MITKWNKSQKASEEFYRCDENRARKLHSAEHDSTSPRLFCVLQRHGVIDWKSFCLSDYIRPRKSSYKINNISSYFLFSI